MHEQQEIIIVTRKQCTYWKLSFVIILALRHSHRNASINPKRNTNKRVVFKTGDTDIS